MQVIDIFREASTCALLRKLILFVEIKETDNIIYKFNKVNVTGG